MHGPRQRIVMIGAVLCAIGSCRTLDALTWSDTAAHTARMVRVRDGTHLHVLDWGGTGPAVVLLGGLGSSAHTFDDLIPLLDRRFHYIAITRRGTGESDRPAAGYDVATRVHDDLDVIAALGVRQCVLIGHSIAGTEMTVIGTEHPEMVRGIVYLEAAYDRGARKAAVGPAPSLPTPVPLVHTYSELLAQLPHRATGLPPSLRNDLEVTQHGPDDELRPSPSLEVRQAMLAADDSLHPDYSRIQAPVLGVFAFSVHHPSDDMLRISDSTRAVLDEWWQRTDWPYRQQQVDKLQHEAPHVTILVLKPAEHLVYFSNTADVVRAINAFLSPLAHS